MDLKELKQHIDRRFDQVDDFSNVDVLGAARSAAGLDNP